MEQQQREFIRPVQMSVKDPNIPPEIRTRFVTKVYSLMFIMLMISFGIAAPFTFYPCGDGYDPTVSSYCPPGGAVSWMDDHQWILITVSILLLVQQMFNMMMIFEMCCGGSSLMQCYFKMFVTVPINYILLLSYSACFGVVLGYICAQYTAASVGLVFLLTASIMFALTVYAITTKSDFSGCGPFVLVLIMGMLIFMIVSIFVHSEFLYKAIAVCGAILMSFVIIFDTQMIFGTAAFNTNSMAAKIEFTVDMYAFAAYQLYLDFVNMFLYLLRIFGERR